MRRIIMALVAGGVLAGAVYGAAASLGTLTGQNIAASDAIVVACDSNGFAVGYDTVLDTTGFPAVQRVQTVRIDNGIDPACAGKNFQVRLTSDPDGAGPLPTTMIASGAIVAPTPLPLIAPQLTITFAAPLPLVSAVDDIHWTQSG